MVAGRRRRVAMRAFTLIEVLVVVAILALLLALLLPSLSLARDQAKATKCEANLRELTRATHIWMTEQKLDRPPSNFGWAPWTLRTVDNMRDTFLCPSDDDPHPMPMFWVRMYQDLHDQWGGPYRGTVSPDGFFNQVEIQTKKQFGNKPRPDRWEIRLQDTVQGSRFGGDLDDWDILFLFDAPRFAEKTLVRTLRTNASWKFKLDNYWGQTIADDVAGNVPFDFEAPLLWSSYGINASAGLRNQKLESRQVLYVEYAWWSAVPEMYDRFPKDTIAAKLRPRHSRKRKANISFVDGHGERVRAEKLTDPNSRLWYPKRPRNWTPTF